MSDDMLSFQKRIAQFAARLQERGIDVSYQPETDAPETCPVCNGLGVIKADLSFLPIEQRINHPAFGKMYPCPSDKCEKGLETRQRQTSARIEAARLPDEYRKYSFDSFMALAPHLLTGKWLAYAACMCFVQHRQHMISVDGMLHFLQRIDRHVSAQQVRKELGLPPNIGDDYPMPHLVLYGKPGTGKTGLAASIVNALQQYVPILYIRAYDIFVEINKRQHADEYPYPEDVLKRFQEAPILVIDEAGIEGETDSRIDRFEAIIRHRMAYSLPTILTTNYNHDQFEAAWKTRAYAVLNRKAWWIPVGGDVLSYESKASKGERV